MRTILALCALLTLTACDGTTSGGDTGAESSDGARLYATTCAACHGADGRGNAVGPDIRGELDESNRELVDVILDGEGSMPPQPVSEDEARAIVEWMKDGF